MSDKIFLSPEEQSFLMHMFETSSPIKAAEDFAYLMALEKADPMDLQQYLKIVMKKYDEKFG